MHNQPDIIQALYLDMCVFCDWLDYLEKQKFDQST